MAVITCPECGAKIEVPNPDCESVFCPYCGIQFDIAPFVRYTSASHQPKHAKPKSVYKKQKAHDEPNHESNVHYNFNYSKSEHTEHIVDDAKIKAAENASRVINIFASPFEERRAKKKAEEERIQREAEEAERLRKEQEARDAEEARIYKEWASTQREKHARQAGRAIAKGINYYKANKKNCLIAFALVIALLAGGNIYSSASKKHAQELAAHRAELARLEEERIANSHLAMGEVKMPDISRYGDYRNVVKQLKDAGFINVNAVGKGDLLLGILDTENDIIEITVDGAPEFETDIWYAMDVPIVITYHSFYSSQSASSTVQVSASEPAAESAVPDTASQAATQEVATSSAATSEKVVTTEEMELLMDLIADDIAYVRKSGGYSTYCYISPSQGKVWTFSKGNGSQEAYVGHITDGTRLTTYTVHYRYDPGWDEIITFNDESMVITDAYGYETTFTKTDAETVKNLYDAEYTDIPE
jgi:hypothetical protein